MEQIIKYYTKEINGDEISETQYVLENSISDSTDGQYPILDKSSFEIFDKKFQIALDKNLREYCYFHGGDLFKCEIKDFIVYGQVLIELI